MTNYKKLYKEHFREEIENYRKSRNQTYEQMSELLEIAPRSYADLVKGKFSPSLVTAVQYLLVLTDEQILHTFHELQSKVKESGFDESA